MGKDFYVIYRLYYIKYLKSPDIIAFVANFLRTIGTRLGKNVAFFNMKLNNLNIRRCLLREISTQEGKNVAYFSETVRELGKVLHV